VKESGVEHVDHFVLVLGLHDDGARDGAEISDVEEAVWVGPSLWERPARSMTKTTGRFWRQTSWMMGS